MIFLQTLSEEMEKKRVDSFMVIQQPNHRKVCCHPRCLALFSLKYTQSSPDSLKFELFVLLYFVIYQFLNGDGDTY